MHEGLSRAIREDSGPVLWTTVQISGHTASWQERGAQAAVPERCERRPGAGGSRNVWRILGIFDLMLDSGELIDAAYIVKALIIPKSTTYELVRSLVETGLIEPRGRSGGFFLGRKLFELGMAYRAQVDLLKDGSQIVEDLRDLTGETVQLSVLEDEMMHVLIKEEGSRPIRIVSRIGSRMPVNWAVPSQPR